jgi:glycosyltransferase involved in cell wall biosynthesis
MVRKPRSGIPRDVRSRDACMSVRRLLFVVNDTAIFASHRLPVAIAAGRAGYEVHLAALDSGALDVLRAHDIGFHQLRIDRTGLNPIADLRMALELGRIIRKVRPTLMHTVTIKPVIYGGILARLLGVPKLVSAITGLGQVFTDQRSMPPPVRALARALYRLALGHRNSCTIFQNPDDRAFMVGAKLVSIDRTALIRGSGVDMACFAPRPEPPRPAVVVLPARLLWDKGIGEFVEAARILRDACVDACLALVGEPPPHNRASVPRETIEGWVREGLVEWWGHQTDMPEIYARSHIVCLPSYYGEGVPRALIEAAACGRPIVTADTPGCREVVRHGVNGLLVPPRAAAALAEALRELLLDPARCEAMGRRGRELAVAEFSVEHVVEATLKVYAGLEAQPSHDLPRGHRVQS